MNILAKKVLSLGAVKRTASLLLRKKGKPLYAGFVIHSEMVQDIRVFNKLMELGAWLTFKPALCVMTPRNPYIREDMSQSNVTEVEFARRLKELNAYYDMGFHGHWCRKGRPEAPFNTKISTRIEKAGFTLTLNEPPEIEKQFKEEYDFFKEYGVRPQIYSAGWWFLNDTVVKLLDSYGFMLDCSLRRGYPDTFGGRYMPAGEMPPLGKPFLLKPSRKVLECAGIFYLNANWWTLAKDLYPALSSADGPSAVTVPLHDYDLLDDLEKVKENITLIGSLKNVSWLSASGLLSLP